MFVHSSTLGGCNSLFISVCRDEDLFAYVTWWFLQQLAYQYAPNRASLVLVARREWSLRKVADQAFELGAPDVIILRGDVANPEDCKRFVQTTIDHYGRCKSPTSLICSVNFFSKSIISVLQWALHLFFSGPSCMQRWHRKCWCVSGDSRCY